MSRAMNLVGIILLGIIVLVIVNLMSDVRTTSELSYYLLQELTEASMYDAVDYSYYRDTGLLKVDRDMFLENFARRFATSVTNNRDYNFRIIDFNETPPKASIEVTSQTLASVNGETAVLKVQVSGILEYIYDDLVMSRGLGRGQWIDTTPPIVTVTTEGNTNVATMSDDVALEEYCIAYLPKEELNYDASKATGGFRCYNQISGLKNTVINRNGYASNDYNEWIVVYDRSNNYTYYPLADTAPYIKSYDYGNRNLNIVMRDNENVSSYLITMDSTDYNNTAYYVNGGWQSAGKNIASGSYQQATVNINDFYANVAQIGTHNYYIFARDNTGQISQYRGPIVITKKDTHKPQILQAHYDKLTKAIYITVSDQDGDLSGYIITTSTNRPSTGWISISGSQKNIVYGSNSSPVKAATYYVYVKDSEGNWTQSSIKVQEENKVLVSSSNQFAVEDGCRQSYFSNGYSGCVTGGGVHSGFDRTYTVDTNNYSSIEISVSNLRFENKSPNNPAPNCAWAGICSTQFYVEVGGQRIIIQSWGVKHQDKIYPPDENSSTVLKSALSGTFTIDLASLGIKNTGDQEIKFGVAYNGVNGLSLFQGNVTSIILKN